MRLYKLQSIAQMITHIYETPSNTWLFDTSPRQPIRENVRTWKGWEGQERWQDKVALFPGRTPVPSGPTAPPPPQGELRRACGGRGASLPGRCARVLGRRGVGVGRERRARQQGQ